jgi:hypothetical protein
MIDGAKIIQFPGDPVTGFASLAALLNSAAYKTNRLFESTTVDVFGGLYLPVFPDDRCCRLLLRGVKDRARPLVQRWTSGGYLHLLVFYALSMVNSPAANRSYQTVGGF